MRNNLLEALSDNIAIDKDKCVFCGTCVERCIVDNLRLRLAPCAQSCPLGVNIQGYIQLAAREKEDEARAQLLETLPFPSIIGHICDAECEQTCYRATHDGSSVGINDIKRYLFSDPAVLERMPLPECEKDTGKRVAVIGSGPAGLIAAYDLRLQGHEVTVFERAEEPGGMLTQIIPEFRLPLSVAQPEIGRLQKLGIKFQCSSEAGVPGTPYALDALRSSYDAVIVATGLGEPKRLGIAGESNANVMLGLPFLRAVKTKTAPSLKGNVAVIGGGNTAVDAALAALRQGASYVTMVSLEARQNLPAFRQELAQAEQEGVVLECGWGVASMELSGDNVKALVLQQCTSVCDEKGCFAPSFAPKVNKTLLVDYVLIAVGQNRDNAFLQHSGLNDAAVEKIDRETLQLVCPSQAGATDAVFAAGDWVSGPSSAIRAMASGRRAAESAHLWLIGMPVDYARDKTVGYVYDFEIEDSKCAQPRQLPPMHTVKGKDDWKLTRGALDQKQAHAEASRCNSCGGPYGKYRTCWFCLPCEVECKQQALYVQIPYLMR